jgi:hypothetical protein
VKHARWISRKIQLKTCFENRLTTLVLPFGPIYRLPTQLADCTTKLSWPKRLTDVSYRSSVCRRPKWLDRERNMSKLTSMVFLFWRIESLKNILFAFPWPNQISCDLLSELDIVLVAEIWMNV